jgi:uncharacterized protein DUF1461
VSASTGGVAPRPARWSIAIVALCLAVFGVIEAIYVFSSEDTYRALVMPETTPELTTALVSGRSWTFSRDLLPILHRRTLAYVLGGASALPEGGDGAPFYDGNESAHLADVRRVFAGARVAWAVSALVGAGLLIRAWRRREAARLIRDAALAAASVILIVALVFAFAFEPAFLAFHYLFFPEGNFLFDPATSHLLLVYPERYWYGVILRVGLSVVASALVVALVAHLATRGRSAIVRPAMGHPQ